MPLLVWNMMIDLYHDDCLSVLPFIPDNSIDLVLTDCPYKIVSGGCRKHMKGNEVGGIFASRKTEKRDDWNEHAGSGKLFKHNDIQFKDWIGEIYRVLKHKSHCYIMINSRNLAELQKQAEKVGFTFQNLLIWQKGNVTPNRYYMQGFECILMLRKGAAKTINHTGTSNILAIPNIIGNKRHPTEKPVELMKILIENSTQIGEIVLDPFMGCGSTGVACLNSGRGFIGIEIDKQYFDIAEKRCLS